MKKKKVKKKKEKNYMLNFFNQSVKYNLVMMAMAIRNKISDEKDWLKESIDIINNTNEYNEINLINIKNYLIEILYVVSFRNIENVEDIIELKAKIKELTKKFKEMNNTEYIKMQLDLSTIYNLLDINIKNPEVFLILNIAKDTVALICVQESIIENRKIKTILDGGNVNYKIEYVDNEVEFDDDTIKKAIKELTEDKSVGIQQEISNKYTLLNDKFLENKYVQYLLKDYTPMNSYAAIVDINDILTKYNDDLYEKIRSKRRYVYPQEGVLLSFKNHKHIKSIELYEDKYFFLLKYNIVRENIHKVKEMTIDHEEGELTGFTLDIDKESIVNNDNLLWKFKKENLSEVNYYNTNLFSIDINNNDGVNQFHKLGIIALYIALCQNDYLASDVIISRINNNYAAYINRSEHYRIAHIRHLSKGMKASENAKNSAKEYGIILPIGYTFVKEHNPEMAKQKILKI